LITLNGAADVTVECHTSYADVGAAASDTCAGDLTSAIVFSGSVDVNTVGTYTLHFNVSDPSGNAAVEVLRNIHVVDSTAPLITLNGAADVTVECHSSYTDEGATASDSCAGDLTAQIAASNPVNANVPGTYTITYNVADPSGNAADPVTRTVHVTDTTKPSLTVLGANPATVECHTGYTDAGASATDNCAGDLTSIITAVSTVNPDMVGTYTVTYTVSDGNGNSQQATRTVNVVDTTKPVITLNGAADVTVECHTPYSDLGATASDTCAGNLTSVIVLSGSVNANTVGTYTLHFNVSDPS